uniref:Uncharacterized protein n=1 Tax=Physcomitrium patens TaxID=3218 RepID=A0A7I3Z9V3_PHYPA
MSTAVSEPRQNFAVHNDEQRILTANAARKSGRGFGKEDGESTAWLNPTMPVK